MEIQIQRSIANINAFENITMKSVMETNILTWIPKKRRSRNTQHHDSGDLHLF